MHRSSAMQIPCQSNPHTRRICHIARSTFFTMEVKGWWKYFVTIERAKKNRRGFTERRRRRNKRKRRTGKRRRSRSRWWLIGSCYEATFPDPVQMCLQEKWEDLCLWLSTIYIFFFLEPPFRCVVPSCSYGWNSRRLWGSSPDRRGHSVKRKRL